MNMIEEDTAIARHTCPRARFLSSTEENERTSRSGGLGLSSMLLYYRGFKSVLIDSRALPSTVDADVAATPEQKRAIELNSKPWRPSF